MKKVLFGLVLSMFLTSAAHATEEAMKWVYSVDRIVWTGTDYGTLDSDRDAAAATGKLEIFSDGYELNAQLCDNNVGAPCMPMYDKRTFIRFSESRGTVFTENIHGEHGEVRVLNVEPLVVEWVLNEWYGNTIVITFKHEGDFPIE